MSFFKICLLIPLHSFIIFLTFFLLFSQTINLLQNTQNRIKELVYRKNIVELSCLNQLNPDTNIYSFIVSILKNVLSSIQNAVDFTALKDHKNYCRYQIDDELYRSCSYKIPIKAVSHGEIAYIASKQSSFLNYSNLQNILKALTPENFKAPISIDEYYAMIELSVDSNEMKSFLAEYNLPPGILGLNLLRSGYGVGVELVGNIRGNVGSIIEFTPELIASYTPAPIPYILLDQTLSLAIQMHSIEPKNRKQVPTFLKILTLLNATSTIIKSEQGEQFNEDEDYNEEENNEDKIIAHLESIEKCIDGVYSHLFVKNQSEDDQNENDDDEDDDDDDDSQDNDDTDRENKKLEKDSFRNKISKLWTLPKYITVLIIY